MERGSVVVSGRIDEVNRRVMGDTLLSVEVLGEIRGVSSPSCGADARAGAIERKNGAYEFRFDGDARRGQRAAGDPGTPGSSASPRSCAARTTWKIFSSRSGRGSCRDELGSSARLARQSDLRQARAVAAAHAAAGRGDRGRAWCSAFALPGGDTSSRLSRTGARSERCWRFRP